MYSEIWHRSPSLYLGRIVWEPVRDLGEKTLQYI